MKCDDELSVISWAGGVRFVSLCLVMLAGAVGAAGQTPSAVAREQMEKLEFLVGEWKGKGWMYRLDGSRGGEVSQSTEVKRGKDGSTLSVKEKRRYPDLRIVPGQPFPGLVLSQPVQMSGPASVYYDEGAKQYFWRWETVGGRKKALPAMLVGEKSLQLKFEAPGVLSVITIKVTEGGEWQERRDIWLGEKEGWFKAEETVLKRVK